MSTSSRRESKVFFSTKETTAGTAQNDAYFEGRGMMDLPEPTYLHESDKEKLGSGEHGTSAELEAVYTPWSYKPQRLTEIAYFLSYFLGQPDRVLTVDTGVYRHELKHLKVDSRVLPTFSAQYGKGGATNNIKLNGCVVNDFTITLAAGGNGVVDATFNGFANRHYVSAGTITKNAQGELNSASATNDLSTEPLVNFKCCKVWIANSLESNFGISSISIANEDLGAGLAELTSLVNTVTITGSNGLSGEEMLRAGGCGVMNNYQRKDRTFSVELNYRKDNSLADVDTFIVNNTPKALEVDFSGPTISGSNRYGLDMFFPKIQFTGAPEDGESPINRAATTEIFQDTDGDAFLAYVQSAISTGYNA